MSEGNLSAASKSATKRLHVESSTDEVQEASGRERGCKVARPADMCPIPGETSSSDVDILSDEALVRIARDALVRLGPSHRIEFAGFLIGALANDNSGLAHVLEVS
jgi:hypothetical protein